MNDFGTLSCSASESANFQGCCLCGDGSSVMSDSQKRPSCLHWHPEWFYQSRQLLSSWFLKNTFDLAHLHVQSDKTQYQGHCQQAFFS